MKTYTIYANCQGEALSEILDSSPNFKQQYELVKIKPVQLIEPSELDQILAEIVSGVDLLIYQPISAQFNNDSRYSSTNFLKHLKTTCRCISFPSSYFRGYHPELGFLKNDQGKNTAVPIHKSGKLVRFALVHDLNIIKAFVEGKSVTEITNLIERDDFYDPRFLNTVLEDSFSELRKRENSLKVDIIISNFIERRFREQKLFHTFNHPDKSVFLYIAACLLRFMHIKPDFVDSPDPLGNLSFPIYSSTYNSLKFNFPESGKYKIVEWELELVEIVSQYYKAYESLPREILQNRVANWNPAQLVAY